MDEKIAHVCAEKIVAAIGESNIKSIVKSEYPMINIGYIDLWSIDMDAVEDADEVKGAYFSNGYLKVLMDKKDIQMVRNALCDVTGIPLTDAQQPAPQKPTPKPEWDNPLDLFKDIFGDRAFFS